MELVHFINLFWIFFATKTGFNHLETWWFVYFNFWLKLLLKSPITALVIYIVLLNFRHTRNILLFFTFFWISIITSQKGKLFVYTARWFFEQEMRLKIQPLNLPAIYVLNYPANHIEYFLPLLFSPVKLMVWAHMGNTFVKHIFGDEFMIKCGSNQGTYAETKKNIMETISRGTNIVAYTERDYSKRKTFWEVDTQCKSGIYQIAADLNIPLVPVCFSHIEHIAGIITNHKLSAVIGPILKCSVSDQIKFCQSFWNTNLLEFCLSDVGLRPTTR